MNISERTKQLILDNIYHICCYVVEYKNEYQYQYKTADIREYKYYVVEYKNEYSCS